MTHSLPFMASHKAALSPILYVLYVSDIPQPLIAQLISLSTCATSKFRHKLQVFIVSILGCKNYLSQILTWYDWWRIKLNARKTHLINFSQRKVIKDTLIAMYVQPLSVTESVKLMGVH